nr:ORF7a protein [Severe acute respiratory syndrome coronavirus 2]
MKIILFLALITLATCELYHYQECVRGTTVLLKEPCSSGTYEGNSSNFSYCCGNSVYNTLLHTQKKDSMIELSLIDFYLCFLAFLLFLVLIMLIIFWFSLELQDHNETCHA